MLAPSGAEGMQKLRILSIESIIGSIIGYRLLIIDIR
jgi:hypothetical protein